MVTRFHWPRFHLFHLASLVAGLAVIFAILPATLSPIVAVMIVLEVTLHAVIDRLTLIEWLVLASIAGFSLGLALPPIVTNCGKRGTPPAPMITNAPVSSPLQFP